MDGQARRPFYTPPPTQSMWVPFPGSKRKAEEDLYVERGFGPTPAKVCVLDKDLEEVYALKEGGVGGLSPLGDAKLFLEEGNTDEEMKDVQEDSSPFSCAGAPLSSIMNTSSNGDGMDELEDEHVHEGDNENSLINSPKLYLLEGLREVLLSKPCDDLILQHALRKSCPRQSMAIVLWQPQKHPSILSISKQEEVKGDEESVQNTSAREDKCFDEDMTY